MQMGMSRTLSTRLAQVLLLRLLLLLLANRLQFGQPLERLRLLRLWLLSTSAASGAATAAAAAPARLPLLLGALLSRGGRHRNRCAANRRRGAGRGGAAR